MTDKATPKAKNAKNEIKRRLLRKKKEQKVQTQPGGTLPNEKVKTKVN